MSDTLRISPGRLMGRMEEINRIGSLPGGGNCRLSLSDEDKAARDLLGKWMKEEGLEVKVDEVGNMYGIRLGKHSQPGVALGSHLDTVTTGGRFDGTYGVMAALEVMSVLNEHRIETTIPVVLINFTNEEGARFAPDMMGSLVVSRPELRDSVWAAKDLHGSGITVKDELERIGYLGQTPCGSIPIGHYLELHIEQGPILEKEGIHIGCVEKVQGIFWTEYILTGQAAHAGTTPLALRKDAGLLAARVNVFLRELAEDVIGQLGTIGLLEHHPNVINVVPGRVRLITDLRNPDHDNLIKAQMQLDDFIERQSTSEGITVSRMEKVRLAPVDFSPDMVSLVDESAKRLGLSTRRMVSGAGHDAQMMAAIAKAAMIFVPSVKGISHNEKEFTKPEDLLNGANVLLEAVMKIAT